MIDYMLIRSRRKTLGIRITDGGDVQVRAPFGLSIDEINRIVESKRSWINKHVSAKNEHNEKKKGFALGYSDSALMMGTGYPIVLVEGETAGFDGRRFCLPPGLHSDEIRRMMVNIYRSTAKRIIYDKVRHYSHQMKVEPSAVKINGSKKRWASCSGRNSLNFSWRLIMADDDAVNYVVIHELAHIMQHNHSRKFWEVVAIFSPNYKECIKRLNELHDRLECENWE